jgi:hypothetical protein
MERARRFTSRLEAKTARPRLDDTCPIPLEKFKDLIGDYIFPKTEYVRCQLVDQKGKCRKLHGWGWIAQIEGGAEGFIGHDCADDQFRADPRFAGLFAAAAARASREITTDALVERLRSLLQDPNTRSVLDAAVRKQQRVSDRIVRLRNHLNQIILKKLTARAKLNDGSVLIKILYVETEVDEKTGREYKVTRPQEHRWGTLVGLEAINNAATLKIGRRLSEARAALANAVASAILPDKQLSKWANSLEYIARAEADLSRQEVLVDNFTRPENLKLLWLLAQSRLEQIAIVTTVLEIGTRKPVTEGDATAARDTWAQEIRDAYVRREFEVVG